jgi:hypothetical protein
MREEKLKGHWLKARERWEQGGSYYKEGFEEGVYRDGLYQLWTGYTDLRESSTGMGESLGGSGDTGERLREGSKGEESWEGLTDEEAGLQDG